MKKILAVSALALAISTHPLSAQEAGGLVRLPESIRPFLAGVIEAHPRTASAVAAISRARAEAVVAGQYLYNPELEMEAAPVTSSPPDTDLKTAYSARISMAVDVSGKRGLRESIGGLQAKVAEAEAHAAQLALAAETFTALAEVHAARQRLDFATKQAELAQKFLELSEKRQKAGELPAADLGAAQLVAAEAISAQKGAEFAVARSEEALRATCLCDIDKAPALPRDLPVPPKLSENLIDKIAALRPEVLAARQQVESARQSLALARAQRIPDPSLKVGASKEGEERRVLVGLSIPIPVLNTGSAEVSAAGKALTQAEVVERQAVLENAAAIRAATRSYQKAVQTLESWQRLGVPSLEKQSELLTKLWRAGELSATDFLVQLRETARANATEIELRETAWSAFATALKAVNQSSFVGVVNNEE